jgi:hypothetical protein
MGAKSEATQRQSSEAKTGYNLPTGQQKRHPFGRTENPVPFVRSSVGLYGRL